MHPDARMILRTSLDSLDYPVEEKMISRLEEYVDLVQKHNKIMNLVGKISDEEFVHKHVIDSVMPLVEHPAGIHYGNTRILDAGSGAGLPGIPSKILCPTSRMVMVESRHKKTRFLSDVIVRLQLMNTRGIPERLEDIAHDGEYRAKFDVVLARALGKMPLLAELCLPFVSENGYLIVYKSRDYKEELDDGIKVAELMGGELADIREFTLPGTRYFRVLLYFKKTAPTPEKFPRKAGIPQKRPLHTP